MQLQSRRALIIRIGQKADCFFIVADQLPADPGSHLLADHLGRVHPVEHVLNLLDRDDRRIVGAPDPTRQHLQKRNVGGRGAGKGDVRHGPVATAAFYHPPP